MREQTQWGHTQLKVHLKRLEELEYLLLHRSPSWASTRLYELAYQTPAAGPAPFSRRPDRCRRTYDGNGRGQTQPKSGHGRPKVGPKSGQSRPTEIDATPDSTQWLASMTAQKRVKTHTGATFFTTVIRSTIMPRHDDLNDLFRTATPPIRKGCSPCLSSSSKPCRSRTTRNAPWRTAAATSATSSAGAEQRGLTKPSRDHEAHPGTLPTIPVPLPQGQR